MRWWAWVKREWVLPAAWLAVALGAIGVLAAGFLLWLEHTSVTPVLGGRGRGPAGGDLRGRERAPGPDPLLRGVSGGAAPEGAERPRPAEAGPAGGGAPGPPVQPRPPGPGGRRAAVRAQHGPARR